MTVFRRHGNAELWSCFQKNLPFWGAFKTSGVFDSGEKRRRPPLAKFWGENTSIVGGLVQSLGGPPFNLLQKRRLSIDSLYLNTQPLVCVSVCIHVCNCLLKVNWSIARKESRLTAIRVQVVSYLLPDRNLQRPAAEIMNSLQTFCTHTQGSIYSHWKERSLWSLS